MSFGNIFSTNKIPQSILNAAGTGNATSLARHFNQSINLIIEDKKGIYNKGQAEILLKDFFKNNIPLNFKVLEQQEQLHTSFAICNFQNELKEEFSLYIQVREFEGKSIITKLKIEII